MEEDFDKKIKIFFKGVATAFLCILMCQWLVGSSTPWSTSMLQTFAQTWDGIKSPVTGRVAYRVKDLLNKDTIHCDDLAELSYWVDYLDNINIRSENGTTLLIALARAQDHSFLKPDRGGFKCRYGLKGKFLSKLLAAQINLNARDNRGRTAMMWNEISNSIMEKTSIRFRLAKLEAASGYVDTLGFTAADYQQKFTDWFQNRKLPRPQ